MQKVKKLNNRDIEKYVETSSRYVKEVAEVEIATLSVTDFPELRNTKQAYSISSTALARAQGGIPSAQGMSFMGVTSHTNRISP